MELETFAIPTFRKEVIADRLKKLSRKAAKYGNGDITFSFGKTFNRKVNTEYGEISVEYIEISVSGEAPRVGGWQLLSRVELLGTGENLIHSVPGVGVDIDARFRTHNGHCDHCNSLRRRNDVYVLTDGSKQIAVGRSCLRDFLGIDDPKGIVGRAQIFEEIRSIQDEDFLGGLGGQGVFSLQEVLTTAAAFIRVKGYVSKARQNETGYETTGEAVGYSLRGVPSYKIEVNDEDRNWAAKTIEFFRREESFSNDYMENIRVLMKDDLVRDRHMGLIASSVITTQRELAEKVEEKESNYVGNVKDRLRGLDLILERIVFLGHGSFGPAYLHLMKDDNCNAFSWITGSKIEEADGTRIKVDASVKGHKLYKEKKQTVLTRVKVLEKKC